MRTLCLLLLSCLGCLGQAFSFADPTVASWGGAPAGNANVTSGLVAWYKLDDGSSTTAIDSINAYNGTLSGSLLPIWTNGIVGTGSLQFDGTNSSVVLTTDVGTATSPNVSLSFSITCWIKPFYSHYSSQTIYGSARNSNDRTVLQLFNDFPRARAYSGTNDWSSSGVITPVPTNTWTFISMVCSNNLAVYLYQNATLLSGTDAATTLSSQSPPALGTGSGYFPGMIDDFRVYNRVLTPAEITTIYNYR